MTNPGSFGGDVVEEDAVGEGDLKSKKMKFNQMDPTELGPSKVELAREQFSADELKSFEDAFGMFDVDGNGRLEVFEIERVLNELDKPMSRTQILDLLYDAGLEGTVAKGGMEIDDFIQMMAGEKNFKTIPLDEHQSKMVTEIFETFDNDGDGYW